MKPKSICGLLLEQIYNKTKMPTIVNGIANKMIIKRKKSKLRRVLCVCALKSDTRNRGSEKRMEAEEERRCIQNTAGKRKHIRAHFCAHALKFMPANSRIVEQ